MSGGGVNAGQARTGAKRRPRQSASTVSNTRSPPWERAIDTNRTTSTAPLQSGSSDGMRSGQTEGGSDAFHHFSTSATKQGTRTTRADRGVFGQYAPAEGPKCPCAAPSARHRPCCRRIVGSSGTIGEDIAGVLVDVHGCGSDIGFGKLWIHRISVSVQTPDTPAAGSSR